MGVLRVRIIPARAGQTNRHVGHVDISTDHPRACGANPSNRLMMSAATGSSPRVRGKRWSDAFGGLGFRIIPARAGQTRAEGRGCPTSADHPRACGANRGSSRKKRTSAGSSPRVRGKLSDISSKNNKVRIIPARAGQTRACRRTLAMRAGQTRACRRTLAMRADHPRACGANELYESLSLDNNGSSPRVRGKHAPNVVDVPRVRIIPARAGQTRRTCSYGCSCSDHPRACGANCHGAVDAVELSGSSPRVRGKRHTAHAFLGHVRIIPARAGQTGTHVRTCVSWTDHPRACGANQRKAAREAAESGSSPRVRGKQSDFMRKLLSAGPSIIGFAQWLQSSCYCSCFQSSAKTPISRGTTPTSLFLGFQNSITLLLLT